MADSATAAGVRTSSHAGEKTHNKSNTGRKRQVNFIIHHKKIYLFKRGIVNLRSVLLAMVPLKEREMDFLDSSSAGVCSKGTELTS